MKIQATTTEVHNTCWLGIKSEITEIWEAWWECMCSLLGLLGSSASPVVDETLKNKKSSHYFALIYQLTLLGLTHQICCLSHAPALRLRLIERARLWLLACIMPCPHPCGLPILEALLKGSWRRLYLNRLLHNPVCTRFAFVAYLCLFYALSFLCYFYVRSSSYVLF